MDIIKINIVRCVLKSNLPSFSWWSSSTKVFVELTRLKARAVLYNTNTTNEYLRHAITLHSGMTYNFASHRTKGVLSFMSTKKTIVNLLQSMYYWFDKREIHLIWSEWNHCHFCSNKIVVEPSHSNDISCDKTMRNKKNNGKSESS